MDLAQQVTDITVILPALNEEKSIGLVIDEIRSLPVRCNILVVDNGSTDGTQKVIRSKYVDVVYQSERGKGNAVRMGLRLIDTPYTIMMDSDYTYPARHIPRIVELLGGKYDVVMGYRDMSSMFKLNRIANRALSKYASVLYNVRVLDLCTGMWGFRTETLKSFNLISKGFTLEADLFVNSLRHSRKMAQVPIGYRPRLDGSRAKIKVWDGARIGWFLLRHRWRGK